MDCRGGLLTGNVKSKDAPLEKGARYDPTSNIGLIMRDLFLSGTELDAVQHLEEAIVSTSLCKHKNDTRPSRNCTG